MKNPDKRPNYSQLLEHAFIIANRDVDVAPFVQEILSDDSLQSTPSS